MLVLPCHAAPERPHPIPDANGQVVEKEMDNRIPTPTPSVGILDARMTGQERGA